MSTGVALRQVFGYPGFLAMGSAYACTPHMNRYAVQHLSVHMRPLALTAPAAPAPAGGLPVLGGMHRQGRELHHGLAHPHGDLVPGVLEHRYRPRHAIVF